MRLIQVPWRSLSLPPGPELEKHLNLRAREIAGAPINEAILEAATEIAEAEYQLNRVRRTKVAIIERARVSDEAPRWIGSELGQVRLEQGDLQSERSMSSQQRDRAAEAIQRVLPELRKLERYERRAASTLYRAVRRLRHKHGVGCMIFGYLSLIE